LLSKLTGVGVAGHSGTGGLAAFNERRLEDKFPFVLIDAMYIKVRGDERVQSKAVLIASGINEAG
jgi:putative transposase